MVSGKDLTDVSAKSVKIMRRRIKDIFKTQQNGARYEYRKKHNCKSNGR